MDHPLNCDKIQFSAFKEASLMKTSGLVREKVDSVHYYEKKINVFVFFFT
jgi:hypothetical protein